MGGEEEAATPTALPTNSGSHRDSLTGECCTQPPRTARCPAHTAPINTVQVEQKKIGVWDFKWGMDGFIRLLRISTVGDLSQSHQGKSLWSRIMLSDQSEKKLKESDINLII